MIIAAIESGDVVRDFHAEPASRNIVEAHFPVACGSTAAAMGRIGTVIRHEQNINSRHQLVIRRVAIINPDREIVRIRRGRWHLGINRRDRRSRWVNSPAGFHGYLGSSVGIYKNVNIGAIIGSAIVGHLDIVAAPGNHAEVGKPIAISSFGVAVGWAGPVIGHEQDTHARGWVAIVVRHHNGKIIRIVRADGADSGDSSGQNQRYGCDFCDF